MKASYLRSIIAGMAGLMTFALPAHAAEVRVMISAGMAAAYNTLIPEFEKATGNKVLTAYGPSMGTTVNAIPVRLDRGEPVDVLIMVGYALNDLVKQGKATAASRIDLVKSPIGMAVKSGAPKPDIGTTDALKRTLLAAKSIGYSDSASGVYISGELFQRLGIVEEMKGKARKVPAEPVAGVVARGELELGFQQVSELLPIKGIDIVGQLPADVQMITTYAAAIGTNSREPDAGKALIAFLTSPAANQIMIKTGLEPILTEK